ncbi:hypothetical protein ACWT_3874 [Actinoplanes sp. SE50]|uniref:Rv1733c family protein n=1 Tax=unclassified Actinoplanes TaxID=2626549 RepID=UPI00023ED080|nr:MULTISPECIES: hypothetical protein [unclassified Actinoplanes]AEV84898.1 hypothetical protein ACPL_4003 [Actinoplanes sp. SE50/110]ATO83289.1 hypothetical protein ACWT_3874 [Actinoplanes sp. SE50]SLM00696.1 hypothetical protein ACSP50_3929 [Actinoplanes sp. SE50/110]
MIGRRRRSDLRRISDRLESLLVFLLVLTFLGGAPLLARWAGGASYRSVQQAAEWERTHLSQVDAVLTENPSPGGDSATAAAANARWKAPDGTAHTGLVQPDSGLRAGDRIRIWIDDTGAQHLPPADRDPVGQAVLVGIATTLCLAAGLTGIHRIARGVLDRRRDRAWTRDWLRVGPVWSRDSGRY